jgi:hypothetical protein
MAFYYGIGSKKVMPSPMNWSEKDPIQEFIKKLRESNDKESWRLSKKLEAKTRIFLPIIVRGEESEGVKLWQFGKEIYQEFLNMADDEEIGDFTDIMTGRDIKVNTVGPETTGTAYNKSSISPSMKITPLSSDSDLIESLLENQVDPLKIYKALSYDEMKQALQEWLTPEDEGDEEETVLEEEEESFIKSKSNYSLPLGKMKTDKKDKFDNLFKDDDDDVF